MHLLLSELEKNEQLARAVGRLRERTQGNPMRMGLAIDVHPLWLRAYRAEEAGLSDYYPWDRYFEHWFPTSTVDEPLDYSRIPRWWEYYSSDMPPKRSKSPFLLRLIRRPKTTRYEGEEYIQDLVRIAAEAEITTIVEARDPARLVRGPGSKLVCGTTGSTGTLGGFVHDPESGQHYAMTAGHAVEVGPVNTSAGLLGQCAISHAPQPLPHGVACAPGTACPLDVALIEVDPGRVVSTANAVATVDRGYLVEMKGAVSGRRRYEIGPVLLDYELGGRCFNGLTQFNACVSNGFLPISWVVARTSPPRPGDSGAWLLHNGNEWAGMVVAADHLHGYAFDATTILSEIGNQDAIHLQLA